MELANLLSDKRVLITGGTGSLGKVLARRLLSNEMGCLKKLIIFSRDETKQHDMRREFADYSSALEFRIGDIRDYHSVARALSNVEVVFNAAAFKQVPTCEYFPYEAVQTNIIGAENIVRAICELKLPVQTVVGISTDKACKPVNVMGMTKALQERVFIQANMDCPQTRFVCVRYGNVLASRGSVIPLFQEQVRKGEPLTVTTPEMTRFLLSLDDAVEIVFTALREAFPGEIFIPRIPAARVIDIAAVLAEGSSSRIKVIGIRPGEKVHETLISDEEAYRTVEHGKYYAILPMLAELQNLARKDYTPALSKEYSSADCVMSEDAVYTLLNRNGMLVGSPNGTVKVTG